MTLRSIVENVANEAGYTVESNVIASTETTTKQLRTMVQRINRLMGEQYNWPVLFASGSFTLTAGQSAYPLPAAVAAAPYYAPKLANVSVKQDVRVRAVVSAQPMTQQQWEAKYLESQEKPVDPDAVTSTGGASPVLGTLGEIKSVGIENVIGGGECTHGTSGI